MSVRAQLEAGEVRFGVFSNLASAPVVEILARSGFDVVILDHEHSPASFQDAIACMNAARGTGAEIWVRIPEIDRAFIKRILDCGADGIMAPMVETADEARRLVSYCTYPPDGERGLAPGLCRHTSYGFLRDEYMERIGRDLSIVVQIETERGLANVEEIAAVEGVTTVFVGPYDLSGALGCTGQSEHPTLQAAIAQIERAVKACDKPLGIYALPGWAPRDLAARGYGFIITGSDIGYLRAGLQSDADRRRL